MALEQKARLRDLLRSMYEEGIVDDQFCQLQAFKESMGPDFVVRSVISYCVCMRNLFIDLTNHISQVNVNFYAVSIAARDLYERTDSIGAVDVKLACAELLHASEANSLEDCSQALYRTKSAFSKLQRKFQTLVQIERKIIELEGRF
ncbi:histidine-containing phosphotransfer protein 1-like [Syzygium oleosum]|uniref:histidine-containing phosphotransfer protein 1-like n=1 Tax=Syzygium oleosum TaxID=219896 RepID=UPI0011D1DD9E|nr:histidine-containing phosphotransfer protein 1-like [Syzygium oleosum]